MTPYGQDFRDYFEARNLFFLQEKEKETWIWLGVLTQLALVVTGAMMLPVAHLMWFFVTTISGVFVIWGMLSIWFNQRKYTSFDRWLKHRESERLARISKWCGGCCSKVPKI